MGIFAPLHSNMPFVCLPSNAISVFLTQPSVTWEAIIGKYLLCRRGASGRKTRWAGGNTSPLIGDSLPLEQAARVCALVLALWRANIVKYDCAQLRDQPFIDLTFEVSKQPKQTYHRLNLFAL